MDTTKQIVKSRGGRAPYKKGYRFETRVRKVLEAKGFYVQRRHKSAFPDLLALSQPFLVSGEHTIFRTTLFGASFIECKVGKRLSKEELERFVPYTKFGSCYVAYPEKAVDGTNVVVIADAFTRQEKLRLRG